MLGSASEAEDAVQESWVRLGRTDVNVVENLRAWLATVVARVCLDMLRTRSSRREDPFDTHVPDPEITRSRTFSVRRVADRLVDQQGPLRRAYGRHFGQW
jgi:DNA-directed RNA polymerase specialized sigma24 family protein